MSDEGVANFAHWIGSQTQAGYVPFEFECTRYNEKTFGAKTAWS